MAEGASGVHASGPSRIGLPPAAGGVVGPLRPACASCTPSFATPYCRQKSWTRLSAFSLSSDHMPAQRGVIRPCGLTSVISHITSPAQPSEKLPRCMRCQSFAEPLSELYWHIGDTTTRFASVSPRMVMGEKRTLAIVINPLVLRFPCRKLHYYAPGFKRAPVRLAAAAAGSIGRNACLFAPRQGAVR